MISVPVTAAVLLLLPFAFTQVGVILARVGTGLILYQKKGEMGPGDALPFRVRCSAALTALASSPSC
jgi:chromate transporter